MFRSPGGTGASFLALLRHELYRARGAVYAEKSFHRYYDPMRCIRNLEANFSVEVPGDIQQGSIFRSDPGRYTGQRQRLIELYDLSTGPLEQDNLAGRLEVADVQRDLDRRLWSWMKQTQDPLLEGPIASPRYRMALQECLTAGPIGNDVGVDR